MFKNEVNNKIFIIDYIKGIQNLTKSKKSKTIFSFRNFLIGISIFLVPIILGISITIIPFFSHANGTANGWLGFWGGYIGGIVGTLGVIYVAISQNKLQSKLNKEMIRNQSSNHKDQIKSQLDILLKTEQYTRDRILLQNELDLINEYMKELEVFNKSLSKIINIIDQYIFNKSILNRSNHTIKHTPSIKPIYENATKNLDIYLEKILEIHPFEQSDLMYSLKYKNETIKYLNYKTDDIVGFDLLHSIVSISERIKLDNKESGKDFSADKMLADESYKKISMWIRKEISNSHSNIMSISNRLKNL